MSSPQPVQLLATKLFIPRPRADLVPRPRLLARVDAGLRGPVTVLAAPASWGKTTVLSAWQAEAAASGSGTRPVAWVSLDAADNDPVRFWTYVLTALNMVQPGIGDDALALLRAPQPPSIEAILTPLLNALAAAPQDVVLVLDDYHVVESGTVHAAVAFLLDHLPHQLHLVIATREDPPLPLARLRAQGGVTELRAADLSFTLEETAAFLAAALGIALPTEVISALEARSEGWIAGLQLAALSVQGRSPEQVEAFVAAFTGSNRYIADYLVEEVLARQPAAIQDFVLRTAVLDRLCAPLCERLLTNDDLAADDSRGRPPASAGSPGEIASPQRPVAQPLLEQVERANLFLIPLDDERRWYRYHHLFADVLRSRLRQTDPRVAAELHQRASAWFAEQGLVEEAVEHALAAADFERAADLIEQNAALLAVREGRFETALAWLRALPHAVADARPLLKVQHAVLLMYSYQFDAAKARLDEAEADVAAGVARSASTSTMDGAGPGDALPDHARTILGYVAAVRATLVSATGDLARALALARQALDLMPESDTPWRVAAVISLAYAYAVSGDVTPSAERQAAAAMAVARTAVDFPVLTLSILVILGHMQIVQGRLRQALATFREVPSLAVPPLSLANLPGSHFYEVGLGEVLLEWNDLDAAEEHLTQGVDELGGRLVLVADGLAQGYLSLARLRWARGEQAAALATLDTFDEITRGRTFAPALVKRGAAVRAQLAIAAGDLPAAVRWAEANGLTSDDAELPFRRELVYLTLARVRITQGRGDPGGPHLPEALRLLERLLADAEAKGRGHSVLEILILRALAHQAGRDTRSALNILLRALVLAEPEGYIRLFADEGAPMAALLAQVLEAAGQRRLALPAAVLDYAHLLLAATRSQGGGTPILQAESQAVPQAGARSPTPTPTPTPAVPPLLDPLTQREVEVLRLLADGAPNAAIAAALVVSVGTVKKHVFNVCRKLGVQNRTQAVARAWARLPNDVSVSVPADEGQLLRPIRCCAPVRLPV